MCAGTVSSNVVNRNESADSVSTSSAEPRNRIYSDPIGRRFDYALRMLAAFVPDPPKGGGGCKVSGQRPWSLIGDC